MILQLLYLQSDFCSTRVYSRSQAESELLRCIYCVQYKRNLLQWHFNHTVCIVLLHLVFLGFVKNLCLAVFFFAGSTLPVGPGLRSPVGQGSAVGPVSGAVTVLEQPPSPLQSAPLSSVSPAPVIFSGVASVTLPSSLFFGSRVWQKNFFILSCLLPSIFFLFFGGAIVGQLTNLKQPRFVRHFSRPSKRLTGFL